MALTLRNVALSMLIFTTMISGIGAFIGGMADTYGGDQPAAIDTLADESGAIQEDLDTAKTEAQGVGGGIAEGLFVLKSVWNVVKVSFSSLTIVQALASPVQSGLPFNLPTWFISLVTGLVSIVVIYAIVTLYRGITA